MRAKLPRLILRQHRRQFFRFQSTSSTNDETGSSLAESMQSLLKARRTATSLTHNSHHTDHVRQEERIFLKKALDRAVACAQMAPNHKRTEPFSFVRFFADSKAANELAEIAYQTSLSKSHPVAERKRQKWLQIPAFLVAVVHENQSIPLENLEESDQYQGLPYVPPGTEQQLEDVSVLCVFYIPK